MDEIKKYRDKLFEYGIKCSKISTLLPFILQSDSNYINHDKANCILISGPTGSGKTRLASIIRELSSFPMVTIDAKELSEVGYSGKDVSTIFEKLYLITPDGDLEKFTNGIIHIDEFDKLRETKIGEKDVSGIGVQQSLLKPIDGVDIELTLSQESRMIQNKKVMINTRKMLFIFTGTFNGQHIETQKDLITCGFLPELANRIDFIFNLNPSTANDFLSLIQNNNNFINSAVEYAKSMNIFVGFDSSFKEKLASESLVYGGNYRSIKYIFNNVVYRKIIDLFLNDKNNYIFSKDDIHKLI